MKVIDDKQVLELIKFFSWAGRKIYQDHGNRFGVDVKPYAEEKGVDLEEYMGMVKEIVESNPTEDPSTHLYSVQYTILPIYEYLENELLASSDDLKCIVKGIVECIKKERDLDDLV